MKKRIVLGAVAVGFFLALVVAGGLYLYAGLYGFNVVWKRGGSYWVAIVPDDPRISKSMQMALRTTPPRAQAGPFEWAPRENGFETSELPVLAEGEEVDRILLARVDPNKFRFEIHNAPAGGQELTDWMRILNASLVINGSYFARDGYPDTPLLSNGVASGPKDYQASHGAFVTSDEFTGIRDLQQADWRELFRQSRHGFVSYPLLIGPGPSRIRADWRWLANRTFVGQDSAGRIVIGTTKEAFFSLDRLAEFLKQAPLDLSLALNLDGGPVACQGIAVKAFTRGFCGDWETKFEDGQIKLLRSVLGSRRWGLPIVLAVLPK
jgi:hypothetical protein